MNDDISKIPILREIWDKEIDHPLSLDELEKIHVPINDALFHACARQTADRRQNEDMAFTGTEQRNGRDRRLMSYF